VIGRLAGFSGLCAYVGPIAAKVSGKNPGPVTSVRARLAGERQAHAADSDRISGRNEPTRGGGTKPFSIRESTGRTLETATPPHEKRESGWPG
jgi:hypothetical protein